MLSVCDALGGVVEPVDVGRDEQAAESHGRAGRQADVEMVANSSPPISSASTEATAQTGRPSRIVPAE